MPAKKAATKKPAPARTASKAPAKKAVAKKPAASKPPKAGAQPAKRAERVPVQRTRVVFPKDYYEAHKDEIKAPFKAHDMKWTYLGEGKGLYKREKDVHCFAQFLDDGVHYSIWGDSKKDVDSILKAWRTLAGQALYARFTSAGEEATQAEAEQKESEELRLWRLGEPQRRPGEPDFFFAKRVDEWKAKKPSA